MFKLYFISFKFRFVHFIPCDTVRTFYTRPCISNTGLQMTRHLWHLGCKDKFCLQFCRAVSWVEMSCNYTIFKTSEGWSWCSHTLCSVTISTLQCSTDRAPDINIQVVVEKK